MFKCIYLAAVGLFLIGINSFAQDSLQGDWQQLSSAVTNSDCMALQICSQTLRITQNNIEQVNLVGVQTGSIYNIPYKVINDHQIAEESAAGPGLIFDYSVENNILTLSLWGSVYGTYKKVTIVNPFHVGQHRAPVLRETFSTSINGIPSLSASFSESLPTDYETGTTVYGVSFAHASSGDIVAQVEVALAQEDFNDPSSYMGFIHLFQVTLDGATIDIGKPSKAFSFNKNGTYEYTTYDSKLGSLDLKFEWKQNENL